MRTSHVTGLLLASTVCLVAVAAATARPSGAAAAPAKPLDKSYFFGGEPETRFLSSISIAGTTFSGTIITMIGYAAHIALNARKLPGYNAVAFKIGCSDTSDVGTSSVVRVFGDTASAPLATFTVAQGQPARLEIVPFSGHGTLNFAKEDKGKDCEAVLANPAAIVVGSPAAALTIAAPTIAAGGQETMTVAARPATQATVVVTYASGTQQVVGPTAVPGSGRLSVTFTVAQGVRGAARVSVATATADLHGTFMVTG